MASDDADSRGGRSGGDHTSMSVSLTAMGVTLLGVLLSIGVTVGMGISGPLWLRLVTGGGSTIALVAVVKLSTRAGRGPLARAAKWTIGAPTDGGGR